MSSETLTVAPPTNPELPPGFDPNMASVIHDALVANEQLTSVEAQQESRWRHYGKNIMSSMSKDMIVDIGINAALSAVGVSGVGSELLSTGTDTAISRGLERRSQAPDATVEQVSRSRRYGKKLGGFAMGAATAYIAQKFGTEMVDHIQSNLNEGAGSFAIPAASKLGAATLIKSVIRR
jgi:hypothetical protein